MEIRRLGWDGGGIVVVMVVVGRKDLRVRVRVCAGRWRENGE